MSGVLFEDIFNVKDIDPEGRKFDRMHYMTNCKHSLMLLRMGEIVARNMLNYLELLINRYCCM